MAAKGRRGLLQHARERGHLALHEVARVRRQQRRDARRGGVRPVRGAERVVHVRLAERGQLLAERRVVLLLALVEAQVLQHQHVAVAQRRGLRLRVGPHGVGGEHDGPAQKLGQAQRGGAQRERLLEALAGRTAEVAHEDDARAVRRQALDGGQRRADARVVGHRAVFHRHVEVDAHEHALARARPARSMVFDRRAQNASFFSLLSLWLRPPAISTRARRISARASHRSDHCQRSHAVLVMPERNETARNHALAQYARPSANCREEAKVPDVSQASQWAPPSQRRRVPRAGRPAEPKC